MDRAVRGLRRRKCPTRRALRKVGLIPARSRARRLVEDGADARSRLAGMSAGREGRPPPFEHARPKTIHDHDGRSGRKPCSRACWATAWATLCMARAWVPALHTGSSHTRQDGLVLRHEPIVHFKTVTEIFSVKGAWLNRWLPGICEVGMWPDREVCEWEVVDLTTSWSADLLDTDPSFPAHVKVAWKTNSYGEPVVDSVSGNCWCRICVPVGWVKTGLPLDILRAKSSEEVKCWSCGSREKKYPGLDRRGSLDPVDEGEDQWQCRRCVREGERFRGWSGRGAFAKHSGGVLYVTRYHDATSDYWGELNDDDLPPESEASDDL